MQKYNISYQNMLRLYNIICFYNFKWRRKQCTWIILIWQWDNGGFVSHDALHFGNSLNGWNPTKEEWGAETGTCCFSLLFIFAQWQYRSLWGQTEARLLLVENFTQYPALMTWNIVSNGNFWWSLRRLIKCLNLKN